MTMTSPLLRPRERTWQLNTSLLSDPVLVETVGSLLKEYFRDHENSEVPLPTIWEAHKAVVRGHLISASARKMRAYREEMETLHSTVRGLEREHQAAGEDPTVYPRLLHARTQLANALNPQLQRAILRTKCYFALHEDKPGRLLARMLKKQRQRSYIPEILTPSGQATSNPNLIAKTFRDFYSALYHSAEEPNPRAPPDIGDYVAGRTPYRLKQAQGELLQLPVTSEEVAAAIKRQKPGTAPGPDGLPAIYYKSKYFGTTLIPRMVETFNALLDDGTLHPHTLSATIVVLLKPGKDPRSCASYRPISLLNNDLKIFATVLAQRLNPVLSQLVRRDQVGFIPTREARDGTIRTLNVMHQALTSETPTLLLSTDAEKAFDRVSWPFLFTTLRAMNIPPGFLRWIEALYSEPNARVRTNGVLSDTFQIRNGTRQGCPLSPLLFALSLEPFLESIRLNASITGLRGKSGIHKVSAYADDLLFYVSNPLASLPEIVEEFQKYEALSNLKLNMDKSEILNLNVKGVAERVLRRMHPFVWCNSKMKYLGLWLTTLPQDLYRANYTPLWTEITRDLAEWKATRVSWLGKISIIKMNVLPRLLYLFQTLPIYVPPAFFRMIRTECSRFIWSATRARIDFRTLTRPKTAGGLAVPDFQLYYQAAHLLRIVEWTMGGRQALWQDLESGSTPHPTRALPWIAPDRRSPRVHHQPFVGATMGVWRTAVRRHALSSYPSPMLPLADNPDFAAGVLPRVNHRLERHSSPRALHFVAAQTLRPPWDGSANDEPPTPLERFNFAQISHYLLSLPARHRLLRPLTSFESLCMAKTPLKHGISTIYRMLQTAQPQSAPPFEHKWDRILDIVISDDQWRDTYELAHRGSPQARLQSNSYKVITQWYCTPALLFRIGLRTTQECWRCGDAVGTYLHIWWDCQMLTPYWKRIRDTVAEVTDLDLPLTPGTFLLTHTPCSVQSLRKSVALPMLMTARLLVARAWGSTSTPAYRDWLARMEEVRTVEDLEARVDGKIEKHLRKWFHWCAYLSTASCRSRAA
uniref:Reverse transcriptase domain-containing protein n=1 Tax=Leptobrachium leishanense TaxID=445787 RepID=A0A8C5WLI0_9ANUR